MMRPRCLAIFLSIAALAIVPCGGAEAHTGARAFVLLLPTDLYMAGGALVVALSFAVMVLVPAAGLNALERARWRLGIVPCRGADYVSLGVFAVAVSLVIAGYIGSRDPLANPLPPTVWSLWWVGLTFLHAVFGNLWSWLNPWSGVYRLITAVPGLRGWRERPLFGYPARLGYWPATLWFFAFAWFELVDPAPQDPARLAGAVVVYLCATLVGMLLFGESLWLRHGEAFSVFFRMVAWLSPFGRERGTARDTRQLSATLPGIRLLDVGALPPSGVAFILLALASVSFDGLSRTFWWLGLVGENPLEYPGRTVLMAVNTVGLLGVFGALVAAYAAAVLLGRIFAGVSGEARESLGRFVVSIVPIAFGYHFAHYLPAFLVDAQYALRALSDPFALGWNLFGTGDLHVTASFLANYQSVEVIWNLQAAGIVGAHVIAVAIAHLLALRKAASLRAVALSQAPMTALMVGYTLFGLWLLATPSVA